ncbi:MAG: hypothetical protein WBM87_11730, partial [Woeseiaceae bacterium]
SYGSAYSGPVGAVVTPLLVGIDRARDLFMGETLCGACKDACPVDIDLPRMLLALRARLVAGDPAWQCGGGHLGEKAFYSAWSAAIRNPRLYEGLQRRVRRMDKRVVGS